MDNEYALILKFVKSNYWLCRIRHVFGCDIQCKFSLKYITFNEFISEIKTILRPNATNLEIMLFNYFSQQQNNLEWELKEITKNYKLILNPSVQEDAWLMFSELNELITEKNINKSLQPGEYHDNLIKICFNNVFILMIIAKNEEIMGIN